MIKSDVHQLLNENGLKQWQLADALGISETTLCRRLRHPLTEDFETEVVNAIETLKEMEA